MKPIIFFMALSSIFYAPPLFAQTATDLNCTSCVQTSEIQDNAIKSGKINNAAVTSIKISDGTILNADISSMAAIDASKISGTAWTSSNDGSGSSLEADLLDGLDSSQFLRSDISGTIAGDLTATGNLTGTEVCIGADCRSVWPSDGEESSWEDGGDGAISYSGGNVGIGTTSPNETLEITGSGRMFIGDGGGALRTGLLIDAVEDGSYVRLHPYNYGTGTSMNFVISPFGGGNVGIGTTSPTQAELVVSGSVYLPEDGSYWIAGNSDSGSRLRLHHSTTGNSAYLDYYENLYFRSGESGSDAKVTFTSTGNVGIGTMTPGSYKLAVEGTIGTRELIVTEGSWGDFVFKDNYQLKPLAEVESFIQQNKHLPDIPSESEVLANGVSVGDMQKRLLQKVEELTLYVIEQNKEIAQLKEDNEVLKDRVDQL